MLLDFTERNHLIDLLTHHFNNKELKILCARLGIDNDSIDGSSKETLVIDLLSYLENRSEIPQLIALLQKERPKLDWAVVQSTDNKATVLPAEDTTNLIVEATKPAKPSLFISYSHQDEPWKDLLVKYLKVLENQGLIVCWEDRRIQGGEDWAQQIEQAATQAQMAIFLISDDFLASEFIIQKEVPPFLKRRASGELIVFPIIIKECFWSLIDWLKPIQVRPKDGKPLAAFDETTRDNIIRDIVKEIYSLLAASSKKV